MSDAAGVRKPVVAIPDLERPWEAWDPCRDRTMHPYTDADTAGLVDLAVVALVARRAPLWLGDPGATISVLVSLVGEAESRLCDAVADARDQGYSWDQVSSRLCTSADGARRRYGGYVRWRRTAAVDGVSS